MKTYIHVNQHKIRSNIKNGTSKAIITVKQGKKNTYCNEVEIIGPSRIVYCGNGDEKPLLSCGARVVIEIAAHLHENNDRTLQQEYDLIQQKKSNLSRRLRDFVIMLVETEQLANEENKKESDKA